VLRQKGNQIQICFVAIERTLPIKSVVPEPLIDSCHLGEFITVQEIDNWRMRATSMPYEEGRKPFENRTTEKIERAREKRQTETGKWYDEK